MNDLSFVVFRRQFEMLDGITIDYIDEPNKQGFAIATPEYNARTVKRWISLVSADDLLIPQPTLAETNDHIATFQKLIWDDPQNELGHYRLGQHLMDAERSREAMPSLEKALELSGGFPKLFRLLGQCALRAEQPERAVALWQRGCEMVRQRDDPGDLAAMAKLLSSVGVHVEANKPAAVGNSQP